MTLLQSIVLGIVQGLTEFLPISSTAHLKIVASLLGWEDPGAAFTAVTQLGTLLATLVYFRKDLWELATGAVTGLREGRPLEHPKSRLAFGILAGTLPIGILGLTFSVAIKTHLRSMYVIAFSLIALAAVLALAERAARHALDMGRMTFTDAVLVGVGQAFALVPGASRSGSTLTAGLLLGLKREDAARFSFLLSVPAIAAAGLFEMRDVLRADGLQGDILLPTAVATVVAFFFGLGAISFLIGFLRRRSTALFIVYRVALGVLLLFMLNRGLIAA